MGNKKPFFSIVIPTYKRPKKLQKAIKSVLVQTYPDFEIIVSDNCELLSASPVCKSFKDKRIRYFVNKKNIGFTSNFYKAIGLSKGKYIFTLGDDDWLGNKNQLSNIFDLIKNKGYGYIKVHSKFFDKNIRIFIRHFEKNYNLAIKPDEVALKIIDFLDRSIYSGISGLVFIRPKNIHIGIIAKNKNPNFDMSDFWVKYLFNAVKKNGGWVDFEDVVYVSWSQYQSPTFYYLVNNLLPKEAIWELLKDSLSKEEMESWIEKETMMFSRMLSSIKYYSNSSNLIAFTKRLMILNKKLKWQVHVYAGLIIGLLMPKWLWRLLRSIYIRTRLR